MTDATLQGVADNILKSVYVSSDILVSWHSGEPMALPSDFYEHASGILQNKSLRLRHHFQTNGTLITPNWCEFLRRSNSKVGVSLDGPAEIHDAQRQSRRGTGSHSKVMSGIQQLRQEGIEPTIICVLTQKSLNQPEEIFRFFESCGFGRVAFNCEEVVGDNKVARMSNCRVKVESFFDRYMDLLAETGSRQRVREIERICARLFRKGKAHLSDGYSQPLRHLSIDVAGNYWTFSPELGLGATGQQFHIGNCNTQHVEELVELEGFKSQVARVQAGIASCKRQCAYFDVCGGGSPGHKVAETGSLEATRTTFCELSIMAPTDAITKRALAAMEYTKNAAQSTPQDARTA